MRFDESVGAVVVKGGKFLLLKYSAGHWEFVKGHIESGETKEATLMRELMEETGITDAVIIPGFSEVVGYYFRDKVLVSKKVTFLLVKSGTDKVTLSDEHTSYAWLSYDDAFKRLTFEGARNVLSKAKDFLDNLSERQSEA
ncbi:MAG TPA: NUDIX domain-containing protein [Candidatus Nanoarchaeia archaeon]|nr:NUDIX domain-containing protein [Candidatus Nanoarchaeia archaeon]